MRKRRPASRQRGSLGGGARAGLDDAQHPLARPRPELGCEAPILCGLPVPQMPRQLVDAVDRAQLTPFDHPAQRHPCGAFGHPEEGAPLHEAAAGHARGTHSEEQAPDERPWRQGPVEQFHTRRRVAAITLLSHLSKKCNMALVTVATMLPDPEALTDFHPTERLTDNARPAPPWRDELRRIPNLRNAFAVLFLYAETIGIIVAAVWIDNWLVWALAFVLMGRAHAQFAALMHEAAHRMLFRNRRVNDWVGRWLLGFPSFTPIDLYRRGHMAHHRDEFGPEEPDIQLYRGYPIERASLRRKLTRDARPVAPG